MRSRTSWTNRPDRFSSSEYFLITSDGSQSFAVVDTAINDLKPQRFVSALGYVIVEPRIRRHLNAPVAPCPVFGSRHKLCAYALLTLTLQYEPTLDEPYRNSGVAAVGVRAQANFETVSYTHLDVYKRQGSYRSVA